MTDNQHYYYLKLKKNFFEDGTIRILGDRDKGDGKVVTYLRLCLLSLENNGLLMLNENTPYTVPLLAMALGVPEKKVEDTIEKLLSLGLLERLENGTYLISDFELFVGKSSTEADRKRAGRAANKKQSSGEPVRALSGICPEPVRDFCGNVRPY